MTYACSMSGGWSWFMWPFGLVAMVGLWALLIGGGVALYRAWTSGRLAGGRAEDVLTRRFATGEIGEDEYRERLTAIREAGDAWRWETRR